MLFGDSGKLQLLWLLPLVLGLGIAVVRRREKRRNLLVSGSDGTTTTAGGGGGGGGAPQKKKAAIAPARRERFALGLFALAIGLLLVAGARPQWGYEVREVARGGVDIAIAVDVSRSMLTADVSPNRLQQAKREIRDILALLRGDRVALIPFAGASFVHCPLTEDLQIVRLFLDELAPEMLTAQGTDLAATVTLAVSTLKRNATGARGSQLIVVLSDGEDHEGGIDKAAQEARAAGIPVIVMGMGSEDGAQIPAGPDGAFLKDRAGRVVVSRLSEPGLRELAEKSGGAYHRSRADADDTDAIVAQWIRPRQGAIGKGREQRVWYERFEWFAAVALFLLLGEEVLLRRRGWNTIAGGIVLAALAALAAQEGVAADSARSARQAYENGDFERALRYFAGDSARPAADAETLYNRAVVEYRLGKFSDAARSFQEAAEAAAPAEPMAASGDDAGGNSGKNATPKNNNTLRTRSLYNRGNSLAKEGDLPGAAQAYENVLKEDPTDRRAQDNLAWVRRQSQKKDKDSQADEKQQQGKPQDEKSGDSTAGKEQPQQEGAEDQAESQEKEKSSSSAKQEEKAGTDGAKEKAAQQQKDAAEESEQQKSSASDGKEEQQAGGPPPANEKSQEKKDGDVSAGTDPGEDKNKNKKEGNEEKEAKRADASTAQGSDDKEKQNDKDGAKQGASAGAEQNAQPPNENSPEGALASEGGITISTEEARAVLQLIEDGRKRHLDQEASKSKRRRGKGTANGQHKEW